MVVFFWNTANNMFFNLWKSKPFRLHFFGNFQAMQNFLQKSVIFLQTKCAISEFFSRTKFLSKNIVSQKLSIKNKVFMMCAPAYASARANFTLKEKISKKSSKLCHVAVRQVAEPIVGPFLSLMGSLLYLLFHVIYTPQQTILDPGGEWESLKNSFHLQTAFNDINYRAQVTISFCSRWYRMMWSMTQ